MKTYIGDGVFAEFDGFAIVLTTEDGIHVENRIVLEPDVLANLEEYMKRVKEVTPRVDGQSDR